MKLFDRLYLHISRDEDPSDSTCDDAARWEHGDAIIRLSSARENNTSICIINIVTI